MRHNVFGKQLSRDTGQRQALLKGLAGALIRSEAIETTETKAKASVSLIEKLITKAKKAGLSEVRQIEEVIVDKDLVQKLVQQIAPRFKDRAGGYIRLIKLGNRVGDNAPMVRMEFTAQSAAVVPDKPETKAATQQEKQTTSTKTTAVRKSHSTKPAKKS
jgi:large subunit ribosomal protein L17